MSGPGQERRSGLKLLTRRVTPKADTSVRGFKATAGDDPQLNDTLLRVLGDAEQVRILHGVLGPFCHQSRNLLNTLKMSLYLARQKEGTDPAGETWQELQRSYGAVEELFVRLQLVCRPLELALVRLPLTLLLEDRRKAWVDSFAARGRSLELVAPATAAVGDYDPHYLGMALDAFVKWRAETADAGPSARLRWTARKGAFLVEWLEKSAPRVASKPARRGRAQVRPDDAHEETLALPLLGRIVGVHGGILEQVKPAGRHLRLTWPQIARTRPSN
jgi:hypothetical protein